MNSSPAPANIMVVDDTPANLKLLENILRAAGYAVLTFPSGELALKAAFTHPPDLVLLDIMIPGLDGYQVCAQLKANPLTCEIPVIFISALRETHNKVRGFASGGVDYVTKPFQPEEILARVRTHLQLRNLQQSMNAANLELHKLIGRQQCIFNSVGEGIFGLNNDFQVVFMNPMAMTQLGYTLEELYGHNFHRLIHRKRPDDNGNEVQHCPIMQVAQQGGMQFVELDYFTRKDGEIFPVEYTVSSPNDMADGGLAIVVFRDIAEQLHIKRQLEEAATVFEVSGEGIVLTDARGKIQRVNPAFTDITGYPATEVIGQTPRILKSGHHNPAFYHEMWHQITQNGYWEGEVWNRRKDGSIYPEWEMITAIRDEQGKITGYVSQFSDITRRKLTEEEIRYRGNYDALTGLANRSLLLERMTLALKEHHAKRRKLSLLFIDLDRFKQVNDSQGHPAGDLLLQQVARRIQAEIREIDTAARLGGDEFVVMLIDLDDQTPSERVASRLLDSLGHPFDLNGREAVIGASIGIALFPEDGETTETLLRNADIALYRAKTEGRHQVQFFTETMEQEFLEHSHLEADLRHALEAGQLRMDYQPIMDLRHNQMVGVEALLRWHHPQHGMISPAKFIPIAEESGLINVIGIWSIKTVVAQLRAWHDQGWNFYASVNLSAHQIPNHLDTDWLHQLVKQAQLPPQRLRLEITESVFVKNVDAVGEWLRQVRNLGFRVYLDDFGTGYSSLSYLKRFPVDTLKIDQIFIREMTRHGNDQALVRAILAMSAGLNLEVVAEGIENKEQIDILRESNCAYGQGYWFAKPMPAHILEQFISNSAHNQDNRY